MAGKKDLADTLLEEAMVEMADKFFGSRRRVEDMTTVLEMYVEDLRNRASQVKMAAGLLNFLCLDGQTAEKFYHAIGLDPDCGMSKHPFVEGYRDIAIPFALTRKGAYIKLICLAYDQLQKECDDYLHGTAYETGTARQPQGQGAYYQLVSTMCQLINQEIETVNAERSATSILHYVRKFDPQAVQYQHITGGSIFDGSDRLDSQLKFQPVNMEALNLERFPDLPAFEHVQGVIKRFCERLYEDRKADVKRLLSNLPR